MLNFQAYIYFRKKKTSFKGKVHNQLNLFKISYFKTTH